MGFKVAFVNDFFFAETQYSMSKASFGAGKVINKKEGEGGKREKLFSSDMPNVQVSTSQ